MLRSESGRVNGGAIAGVVALVTLVVAVGGGVWWAVAHQRTVAGTSAAQSGSTETFRTSWESAMRKAGVEATLPSEAAPLDAYEPVGVHEFDASFTPEEATALMNVYTYEGDVGGQTVSISGAKVEFPADGQLKISGRVVAGGTSANATIEGPITYTLVTRMRTDDRARVSVEGFGISGEQASQAIVAAIDYGNAYLAAGPGLIAVKASIVGGQVRVQGRAPDRLVRKPGR